MEFLKLNEINEIPDETDIKDQMFANKNIQFQMLHFNSLLNLDLKMQYYDDKFLQYYIALIKQEKQIIFYGPPGTGKTYLSQILAKMIAEDHYEIRQFHTSLGYEDFIEGIDIETTEYHKSIIYKPVGRIFRQIMPKKY